MHQSLLQDGQWACEQCQRLRLQRLQLQRALLVVCQLACLRRLLLFDQLRRLGCVALGRKRDRLGYDGWRGRRRGWWRRRRLRGLLRGRVLVAEQRRVDQQGPTPPAPVQLGRGWQ